MTTRPALAALGVLAVAFALYSAVVAFGSTTVGDRAVAQLMAHLWLEPLRPVALAAALLGGVEIITVIAVALAVYLFRSGFRHEVWALLAIPLASATELAYKLLVQHPEPIGYTHGDGPSFTILLERGAAIHNSYPSGHTLRAVLGYGLLAFVIYRLAAPGLRKTLAIPAAAVIISIVALDRLYLGVHWASDIIGGLLLGGLGLAAAIVWLDQPRRIS
jgi:membrane-associated phospholipid phosphatase